MKEKVLVGAVTLFALGSVIWWTQKRPSFPRPSPLESCPEDVIWAMVRACQKGDPQAYLNCFGGELRRRLERLVKEEGKEAFRHYLQRLFTPIKGLAVFPPEEVGEGTVKVKVELVFVDHNEVQTFRLRQTGKGWEIVGISPPEYYLPPIPYGTKLEGAP